MYCPSRNIPKPLRIIGIKFITFACLSMSTAVSGLICYETNENDKLGVVQNEEWAYCGLVPSLTIAGQMVNGSQFGLGLANDLTQMYNSAFSANSEEYRVLTMCIYERYNFGQFIGHADFAVDFMFRCVCNYDLCNSESNFGAYLTALKMENSNGND